MELSTLSPVAGSTHVGKRKGRGHGCGNGNKAYVLENRPVSEIDPDLLIKEGDSDKVIKEKDKAIKNIKPLQAYYEQNAYLVDLTNVKESEEAGQMGCHYERQLRYCRCQFC